MRNSLKFFYDLMRDRVCEGSSYWALTNINLFEVVGGRPGEGGGGAGVVDEAGEG